jgi:hypothetical protein
MPSGIKGSANRPKLAKHLRNTSEKHFTNTTQADRDREHSITDAWAERERLKTQAADEARFPRRRSGEVLADDAGRTRPTYDHLVNGTKVSVEETT